ncbi:YegP family protein [Nocardia camponoti]|uniref:UPF0339 protein n=1 Tax=Nocardia camponoti TaxID=1616106 RepID=A0A917VDN9_9NOCA|nr:DUF1508 domain-containing protein [Nocardia camponoti]GGK64271.1 UPF0339 protein [Nocardia camponoti]
MAAGKFEIFTDTQGKYRFRLKAANGEIIAQSQAYEELEGAKNGIESIRRNAPISPIVDLHEVQ